MEAKLHRVSHEPNRDIKLGIIKKLNLLIWTDNLSITAHKQMHGQRLEKLEKTIKRVKMTFHDVYSADKRFIYK